MPAAKKKKSTATVRSSSVEKKVEKVSEQMNMLLGVFGVGMILLAYVLYKVYAGQ